MKESKIIIKKVKKGHGGGHHGGEWKVAYADFVTAMMAFFLLMWLLAILSPEKKEDMARYYKTFSFIQMGGAGILDKTTGLMGGGGESERTNIVQDMPKEGKEVLTREELRDELKKDIETKLIDVKDQVLIDIFEGGVRIQIIDKEGSPMFALGSPELTPTAKKIIKVISKSIIPLGNEVAIEGHTDALNFSTSKYTNWELSTERASAARKVLEGEGLDPNRLNRVAGYAARELLLKDRPTDPRNRRISLILMYDKSQKGAAIPNSINGLPVDLIGDMNKTLNSPKGKGTL